MVKLDDGLIAAVTNSEASRDLVKLGEECGRRNVSKRKQRGQANQCDDRRSCRGELGRN